MQHPLPALADPLFRSQIAPDAAFPHPAWQQARAAALAGLEGGGITVLIGPPGSGKSLLLKDLARMLRRAGRLVRLVEQADTVAGAPGGGILLVDEADGLSLDELAVLCAAPAPVLFAALPGFPARLAGQGRPVRQVILNRLQPQDVAHYVAARLNAVGRPRGLLEPEAVLALAQHSDGLLRLINTLGGAAVFLAGLDGSAQVGPHHVEEAASMRDDEAVDRSLLAVPAGTVPVLPPPVAPALPGSAVPAPAALPAGQAHDLAPAIEPPPVEPPAVPVLPNYRVEMLRRRAALGTMVAASGLLFALPWLTRRQPQARTLLAQAAGDGPAPATQADAGSVMPDGVPIATADSSADITPALPVLPPDAPSVHSAAGTLPTQAEPSHRPDKAPPAAATGSGGATMVSSAPVLFQGPIFNETMGQGGHVTLVIRRQAPTGAITARFDASQGLSGAGVLAGSLSGNGQITASGQLLMGRNPFMCDLSGTLDGDTLRGSASFSRSGKDKVYRSRFNLVRA